MIGHTPGPWYVNDDCIEADGPEGPRDVTVAVVHLNASIDADASLIAAAPELLAALKEIVAYDEGSNDPYMAEDYGYEVLLRCKAAIAKAEGRTSDGTA